MTWSLSASGHTQPRAGDENWEPVERELADRLAEVLSDPGYGCGMSSFGGNYVHGPVHSGYFSVPAMVGDRHPSTTAILKHFEYGHLPEHLATVSARVKRLAVSMTRQLDDSPELTAGLRKLLEAKDCFVRAALEAQRASIPEVADSEDEPGLD